MQSKGLQKQWMWIFKDLNLHGLSSSNSYDFLNTYPEVNLIANFNSFISFIYSVLQAPKLYYTETVQFKSIYWFSLYSAFNQIMFV